MPPSPAIRTDTFHSPISMRNALAPLSHTLNLGTPVSYRRNTEIFGEKEPADYAYGSSAAASAPAKSSTTGVARSVDFIYLATFLVFWSSATTILSQPTPSPIRECSWLSARRWRCLPVATRRLP